MKLRNFACLSRDDRFSFEHNDRLIEVLVVEVGAPLLERTLFVVQTRPANAVCIVDCDMNVEFDAPEGYAEPTHITGAQPTVIEPPSAIRVPFAVDAFIPFSNAGRRLVYRSTVKQLMPVHIRRCDAGDSRGIFCLF